MSEKTTVPPPQSSVKASNKKPKPTPLDRAQFCKNHPAKVAHRVAGKMYFCSARECIKEAFVVAGRESRKSNGSHPSALFLAEFDDYQQNLLQVAADLE